MKNKSIVKALSMAGLAMVSTMAAADYKVRCESYDHKYTTCPKENGHGYVRLHKQHSKSPCIKGRTWDYNKRHIWVDDACKATFIVEGRHHTDRHDDHKGEKAIAAVAGLALLAAAAKKAKEDDRYDDDNYYGSRHSSYMPGWMVGRFTGYNPISHARVVLKIKEDGRVKAKVGGVELTGYINDRRLYMGDHEFRLQRAGDGFNTVEVGGRHNVVHYTRD